MRSVSELTCFTPFASSSVVNPNTLPKGRCRLRDALIAVLILATHPPSLVSPAALANVAGGGSGTGPDASVADIGDGTVRLANGIASIIIVKKTGRLNSIAYTYGNAGEEKTAETISNRGQYYYGGFMLGNGSYECTVAVDPASNGGSYADVKLLSDSESSGVMEIHFSMLRGSSGFYSTAIMTHRAQDEAFEVGAWGVVTRVPRLFNWLSADARRNFFIGVPTTKSA